MTDREVNVKIIDLLMDTIGELLYAVDSELIETEPYETLKTVCNKRFGIDFPTPLDLIGHVTQVRDLVDKFLLEKSKKVDNE